MTSQTQKWITGTVLAGIVLGGCAEAELDYGRGGLRESTDDQIVATDDSSTTETVPSQDTGENNSDTSAPTTQDTGKDTASQTQDTGVDTGTSPQEDVTCGANGQPCCGVGLCDDNSLVCIGGWPEVGDSTCLPMCNGTFCNTTEGLQGVCYPTSDPTMNYCHGGDENPATQTCGAYVSCPIGSECLVETTGAAQGKCFKTGCDPYANCTGSTELCIPLVDTNDAPIGYGACIPLL